MRVLFLTCGTEDPGTRFRAAQFFPHFEANGIRCFHHGAYGSWYNDVFDVPGIGAAYKLATRGKRAALGLTAGRFDAVFLQRMALEFTSVPERVLARVNPRMILDADDAIYLDPNEGAGGARRERAFQRVVRTSAHVIAGNRHLAGHVDAPQKTTIIPTVIDTDRFTVRTRQAPGERVVIGWMGTAGNFKYFGALVPAIVQLLEENPRAVFRIVSNATYEPLRAHPRVEQVRWSEATELDELHGFDVGVMPLDDGPWTRGKNGFKLIQYMAVGCPGIASPVGVNPEIVDDGRAGLLASTSREWYQALSRLCADPALRASVGETARRRIVEHYSIASVLETYLDLFSRVVAGDSRNRNAGATL